jgi:NADH-quinone oxidoreductase subunit J
VLFLFVVMMLDINFREMRRGVLQYLPIGITVGLILLVELALVLGTWAIGPDVSTVIAAPTPAPDQITNTHALGLLIYTHYAYLFQAAGLILLIAMIGAIVLTLRQREGVRRQVIGNQITRRREEVVAIRKVPTRGGV